MIWSNSDSNSDSNSNSNSNSNSAGDTVQISVGSNLDDLDLSAIEIILDFPEQIKIESSDSNSISDMLSSDESENSLEEDHPLPPKLLHNLQQQLLQGYTIPLFPTNSTHLPNLTMSQKYSLMHYMAWKKSNGTVNAYRFHAQVLCEATRINILSLYAAQKLATFLIELKPLQTDVCPYSYITYTGMAT